MKQRRYHWRVDAIEKCGIGIHCYEAGEIIACLFCDADGQTFAFDRAIPLSVFTDAIMTWKPRPEPVWTVQLQGGD